MQYDSGQYGGQYAGQHCRQRCRQDRGPVGARVDRCVVRAIAACLLLGAAACSDDGARLQTPEAPPPTEIAAADAQRLDAALAELTPTDPARLWADSCGLCHADGTGGAPRLGDADAWRARAAEGEAALLTHTLEGLGNMPPLGYCMACTKADFRALIRFMVPAELLSADAPEGARMGDAS